MNLIKPLALILIAGLGIFIYSLVIPLHKDEKAAAKLLMDAYDHNKFDGYSEKEYPMRTNKLPLMDIGSGITVASGLLLALFIKIGVTGTKDLKKIKPLKKLFIFSTANGFWLLMVPGAIWYYGLRSVRGDCPPFADSVGVVLTGLLTVLLFAFIPLNIFLVVTTLKFKDGNSIFAASGKTQKYRLLIELFWGFWLLVNQAFLIMFIIGGDHISIVVNIAFTYILLSLRAGNVNTENTIPYNNSLALI